MPSKNWNFSSRTIAARNGRPGRFLIDFYPEETNFEVPRVGDTLTFDCFSDFKYRITAVFGNAGNDHRHTIFFEDVE